MVWGKVLGGTIGAFLGGPVGVGLGVGLGHFLDSSGDDDAEQDLGSGNDHDQPFQFEGVTYRHGVLLSEGPGLMISAGLQGTREVPEDLVPICAFQTEAGDWLRGQLDGYCNSSGHSVAAGTILHRPAPNRVSFAAKIPYIAFDPHPPGVVDLRLKAIADPTMGLLASGGWKLKWPGSEALDRHNVMTLLVDLAVTLVRTAGELERSEVRAIRTQLSEQFQLDERAHQTLKRYLKRANQQPSPMEVLAARTTDLLQPEELQTLLEFLYRVADADGQVQEAETLFLKQYCELIGITDYAREAVRGQVVADVSEHFTLLGLPNTASLDEVRKAYRNQAMEYHPDRAASMPEGFRAFAEERQKALNRAYEALRSHLEPD